MRFPTLALFLGVIAALWMMSARLTPRSRAETLAFASLPHPSAVHVEPARQSQAQNPNPASIIAPAAENGRALLAALHRCKHYAEITIETVSPADTINGKYYRFSEVSYDDRGNPRERVIDSKSTVAEGLHLGTETINNLVRVYTFFLTPETLKQYEFSYVGRERVDELDTYVFDVKPNLKVLDPDQSGERCFKGQVWVDERDLEVVKASGEALPAQTSRRNARFETYYQNYKRHWFPAYTSADDSIKLRGGYSVRLLVRVQMTNYKEIDSNEVRGKRIG